MNAAAASLPVWPFAILAVLLAVGYRQSQTRVVRPRTVARVAAAMLALSLWGVIATFGSSAVASVGWVVGFGAAMLLGVTVLAPRGLAREGNDVRMPGSWAPLGLMMGIFMTKFGLGFATGVHAHVLEEAWFIGAVCAVLGLMSGGFAARATAVHRAVRAA